MYSKCDVLVFSQGRLSPLMHSAMVVLKDVWHIFSHIFMLIIMVALARDGLTALSIAPLSLLGLLECVSMSIHREHWILLFPFSLLSCLCSRSICFCHFVQHSVKSVLRTVLCASCVSRFIRPLELNEEHMIGGVRVTLLEANHCPGAALIHFHLSNGQRYLHTGDFRASKLMQTYPLLAKQQVDVLYLDTTYCNPRYKYHNFLSEYN